MQLVSVVCSPVSSIPTSLSFCPCLHPFFILHIVQAHAQLHKQTNNGMCNHLYVGLLFDSIAFLKKVDVDSRH